MKRILASLLLIVLPSCTQIPGEILGGAPGTNVIQVGGRFAMIAPNGVQIDINNEKSFEDLNRTVNSLGTGWIIADMQKSIEAGKRAVETTTVKESTKKAAIDSNTTLGLAREETARMMIEPEVPAAIPAAPP
jgi:hypothetical protein